MLGNTLRGREDQYVSIQDERTKTWRILDTWHESLKTSDVEDDIPDDSPAVQIITENAFISLMREASRLGIMENAFSHMDNTDILDEELAKVESELEDSYIEIENLKNTMQILKESEPSKPIVSEETYLKEKAMDAVMRITGLSDISKLSQKS